MNLPWWVPAAVLVAGFAVLVGMGAQGAGAVVFLALAAVALTIVARAMRTPADHDWLPRWIALGFAAKLAGSFARFAMVRWIYGYGDAVGYYQTASRMAATWRSGRVPELSGTGSVGTQIVEWLTGLMFAVFTPDLLGGFVIFAVLAFFGQLLLYAAFRRWAKPHHLKPYAALLFLLPTFAFWPSSIGKDALVILGLGLAAYGVSRVLERFQLRWIAAMGLGLAALGAIRLHIAALVVGGAAAAALFARPPVRGGGNGLRRLAFLGGCTAAGLLVLLLLPELLGFRLEDTQDLEFITSEVVRRTSERGTVASGGPVTGPADVPAGLALVLFRPFVFEASEPQHLLAALETTFLLVLVLWRLPAMLGNLGTWRRTGYLVFCTFYTLAFAIAFSAVRNLGIIARQRGQVLAMFLAVVILLGWPDPKPRRSLTDL
ncbi:MAG: hypothetical protein KatS3mg011_0858 [Acidimicrobiia bacterium]|nr:MAG: hypothetical protein KatS3mg011_0858 [Acidimicrobiia bacterium]